jgi:hypothetical protein
LFFLSPLPASPAQEAEGPFKCRGLLLQPFDQQFSKDLILLAGLQQGWRTHQETTDHGGGSGTRNIPRRILDKEAGRNHPLPAPVGPSNKAVQHLKMGKFLPQ